MTAAVQTSAPVDADMLTGTDATPIAISGDLVIEFVGRLLDHAVVTNKLVDHGAHVRPVLAMNLARIGNDPLHARIHAEQIFPESRRKEAEALAATLKRGTHVTVRTTLVDRRTTFPHVQSVAVNPPDHHA